MEELDNIFTEALKLIRRLCVVGWNTYIKCIKSIGLLPFLKKPKRLVWFTVLLCFVFPPITLVVFCIGYVALESEVNAETDFLINKG
jgi:hypothetical protein